MEEFPLEFDGLCDDVLIELFQTLEMEISSSENENHQQTAFIDYCKCLGEFKKRGIEKARFCTIH